MRRVVVVALGAAAVLATTLSTAEAAKGVKKIGATSVRGQITAVQITQQGNQGNTGSIRVRSASSHRKLGAAMVGSVNHSFGIIPTTQITGVVGSQRVPGTLQSLRQGQNVVVVAQATIAQSVQVYAQRRTRGYFHRHYRPYYGGYHQRHRPYAHYASPYRTATVTHSGGAATAKLPSMKTTSPVTTGKAVSGIKLVKPSAAVAKTSTGKSLLKTAAKSTAGKKSTPKPIVKTTATTSHSPKAATAKSSIPHVTGPTHPTATHHATPHYRVKPVHHAGHHVAHHAAHHHGGKRK